MLLLLLLIAFNKTNGQVAGKLLTSENNLHLTDYEDYVQIELQYSLELKNHITIQNKYGEPELPVVQKKYLLPINATHIEAQLISSNMQVLSGSYYIYPEQPPIPLDGGESPEWVEPKPEIYQSNVPYPSKVIEIETEESTLGYKIVTVNLYPISYLPLSQRLELYTSLEFELHYRLGIDDVIRPEKISNYRNSIVKDFIKSIVSNPDSTEVFHGGAKEIVENDITSGLLNLNPIPFTNTTTPDYIIITTEEYNTTELQSFANSKTQKGILTVIVTIDQINQIYPGVDQAEKIFFYLKDVYNQWGSLYVLLAGDIDIIPARYAYYDSHTKKWRPTDLYYSDVYKADNPSYNWNANGNSQYGETGDKLDLGPDHFVGRLSFNNTDELNMLLNKIIHYDKANVPDMTYYNNLLFMTGFIVFKNNVYSGFCGEDINDQLITPLSNAWSHLSFWRLYDDPNLGSFNTPYDETLNRSNAIANLNNGGALFSSHFHLVYHMDHSSAFNMATSSKVANESMNRPDVSGLNNGPYYQVFYTGGCSPNSFDFSDGISEHYHFNSNGGAVAFIGSTSTSWLSDWQYYKYFCDALFLSNNTIISSALYTAAIYSDYRKRIALLGDPSLNIWTNTPQSMFVIAPETIYTGQNTIQIEISNLATGVKAMVCLYKEGEVYARESITGTGSLQTVNLQCTPNTEGEILVTVTAKNYLPIETAVTVSANPDANLYVSNYSNDGDEFIDAGETVQLTVKLHNSGLTMASNVYAVVTCNDDFITVQNNQSSYGTIAAGASVWGQSSFVFTVDATIEDDKVATFNLTAYDAANNTYQDDILIEIKSPTIEQRSKAVIHTTDGDMIIEAGEVIQFDIDLFNNSLSFVQNVNATLSTTSMFVESIQQSQGAYGSIASFETNTNTNEYIFEVSNDYPGAPEPILFDLDVTNIFGQQWQFTFDLLEKPDISGMTIDFRGKLTSIALFWTVYEDILGYNIYRSDTETGLYVKQNTQILPIGYFEDTGLQELTTYYYKVSVVSPTGNESELSQAKQAWTSLAYHPDWLPVTVSNEDHGYFWGAPNVYDLDSDGELEIFIASGRGDHAGSEGTLFGFRHDGEELFDIDNNPTSVSGFANIGISMTCQPAIGDIDNDGIIEIVVATRMGDPDDASKHKLLIYKNEDADNDGKPDLMWEKQIYFKNFNGVVLADMDNDNTLEIIVPNQKGHYIEIFDYLGNNYPGWPVNPGESPSDLKAVSMPVAIDLDGDNLKEIVIGLEGGIYIYKYNGTVFITGQNPVYTDGGRLDCPVIAADIDNDGAHEILFMSIQNTTGYIYAMESNGDLVSGWNSNNHNISLSISSQTWAWPPAFVCGDIDLDGNLEIAVADADKLKVWNNLGDLVLEKSIPLLECQYLQPLIANIDSDASDCEIIIPTNNGVIHAYKLNGNSVLGWPLYLGSTTSIPLIADIDNDSKNEIIAASGSDIFVWDTEGSAHVQWGRARLNSHNNGVILNPCAYNPIPLTVNVNQTWTSDAIIDRDLYVENAILTIKSKISFPSQAKIIVKPGAKLIIDGGTLTNACNEPWQGIQVWGNKNIHQWPDEQGNLAQGYLKLNNAVIENAVDAVVLWNPGNTSTTGGIVIADNTVFRNNNRSIHALYYRNYNPYNNDEMEYRAVFNNCDFKLDSDYLGSNTFAKHIDLNHVKGVRFTACDFSLASDAPNVSAWNMGIGAYSAGFSTGAKCNSSSLPCNDWQNSTFNGFTYGIFATGDQTNLNTFNISRTHFNNNTYGIYNLGVKNFVVLNSEFRLGYNAREQQACEEEELDASGFGIYTSGANGFSIEENYFTKSSSAPTGNYTGILCKESKSYQDIIYKNTFNGLSYGNIAEGDNRYSNNDLHGLEYQCNINTGNNRDFIVTGGDQAQIRGYQGTINKEAGNTFSTNVQLPDGHFKNTGTQVINYFYKTNPPVYYTPFYVLPIPIAGINTCPPNYGGGGGTQEDVVLTNGEKQAAELAFVNNLTDFNNVKSLFDNLTDGGNTQALKAEVETAWPSDMWELRAELLGKSPHLSKEVLVAAADKTDVLPESILFEILSANPDELRKEELMSHLENKDQPLPAYMISILRQLAGGITYKTILLQDMASYQAGKTQAAYKLIRSCLNDSATDYSYLRTWLNNLGNLNADMQIVSAYLAEDNYAAAQAMLNLIPATRALEGDALAEYNDYNSMMQMQMAWKQQNRTIYELDSLEVGILADFAENASGKAALIAKGLLEFAYDHHYCNCLPVDDAGALKSAVAMPTNDLDNGLVIKASPNPASTWVAFDFTLPVHANEAVLQISDAHGRSITAFVIKVKQGQQLWDIRDVKKGVYLYTLKAGAISKHGKLIIN